MYKYCPKCGKEHISAQNFCASCGFNFADTNKSTFNKSYITITATIIICIAAIVYYASYYVPRQPEYSLTKLSTSITNNDYDSFNKYIDVDNIITEAKNEAELFCNNEVYPIVHEKFPRDINCSNKYIYESAVSEHLENIEYVLRTGIKNSFEDGKFDEKNIFSQDFLRKHNVTLLPDGKLSPNSDTSKLDKYLRSVPRYESPSCELYFADSLAYMLKYRVNYFKVDVLDIKKEDKKAFATIKVTFTLPSHDTEYSKPFYTFIDEYLMLKNLFDNQNIKLEMRQNSDGSWKVIRIANITDMYRGLLKVSIPDT